MNVRSRNRFNKDYRLMMKRGKEISALDRVIEELAIPNPLPESFHDHNLSGGYTGYRECHIEPDWLLIYGYERLSGGEEQLLLVRTGSHSDLFE
jgi:mRNA interferase YafQ